MRERHAIAALDAGAHALVSQHRRIETRDRFFMTRGGNGLFHDWRRFCAVLREIASGEDGRPLSGFEAQKRAQAVLVECGYTWPGCNETRGLIVSRNAVPESPEPSSPAGLNNHPPELVGKSGGKAKSPTRRRSSKSM
jgi:hypothetical protein